MNTRLDTLITHTGNRPPAFSGVINPPVHRASTILYPDLASLLGEKPVAYTYGRHHTPSTSALSEACATLEKAQEALLFPSGLAAISGTFLSLCAQGDQVWISDNCYAPTRHFVDKTLARYGVKGNYFDPMDGPRLGARIGADTRLVMIESPGSQTFEITDIAATVSAVRAAYPEVYIVVDNTWASGYIYHPLDHGADISLLSISKFIGGHSDLLMGAVCCNARSAPLLNRGRTELGWHVSADDATLALRGLRSLGARLQQHQRHAAILAEWLQARPEVHRILYPALPDHPQHALWKRDYSGAAALFSFVVKPMSRNALDAFFNGLQLFGIGLGWGGYESLLIPVWPEKQRSVTSWRESGQCIRIHVGLEDPQDLINDLAAAFTRAAKIEK